MEGGRDLGFSLVAFSGDWVLWKGDGMGEGGEGGGRWGYVCMYVCMYVYEGLRVEKFFVFGLRKREDDIA